MKDQSLFWEEIKLGEFDEICRVALGLRKPPVSDLGGVHRTDLFRSASLKEQAAAVQLYLLSWDFRASEFKKFLEEVGLNFDGTLLALSNEDKMKWMDLFNDHHLTKNVVAILTDDHDFNPLFVTDYCDGFAVRFVRSPDSLREEFKTSIIKVFVQGDVSKEQFLASTFEDQTLTCLKFSQHLIAEWQVLGDDPS